METDSSSEDFAKGFSEEEKASDGGDSLDALSDTLDEMIQASQLNPHHPRSLQVSSSGLIGLCLSFLSSAVSPDMVSVCLCPRLFCLRIWCSCFLLGSLCQASRCVFLLIYCCPTGLLIFVIGFGPVAVVLLRILRILCLAS